MLLVLAASAPTRATPADEKQQFYLFMQSQGCAELPSGSCASLDSDNARSIALPYRNILLRKFCGRPNLASARALGYYASPECDGIVFDLFDHVDRWKAPSGAGASLGGDQTGSVYGGVSVEVAPKGEVSDAVDPGLRTRILALPKR